jgi:hypothetical protein
MDATKLPKGQSLEFSVDGRPVNLPGIYVHKDTGAQFITAEGQDGVTQADALMSPVWEHAWEWSAEVPSRLEILAMRKAQAEKETTKTKEAVILEAPTKAKEEVSDDPLPGTGASY